MGGRSSRTLAVRRWTLLAAALPAAACHGPAPAAPDPARAAGGLALPTGEILAPAGRLVPLAGVRPLVLAMHPGGRLLALSGKSHALVLVDPERGEVRQHAPLPGEPGQTPPSGLAAEAILAPDEEGQASYTGLAFAPDGARLYLSNVNGSIKVFEVGSDLTVTGRCSFPLPPARAPRREAEIPAGIAVSSDGERLYVALNLSNRLGELDAATGEVRRLFDAGVAPYDVVLAAGKAYVSNWGGRRPRLGDLTGPAGRGTLVRVDPATHVAREGSVSVIDLASGAAIEVLTGRHAADLAVSPDGRYVVCANAADDTLSVLDTRRDAVVETIWTKSSPADLFGASPNALAFDATGDRLFVANGTQNAVAVIRFRPAARASELLGLIPVGWFPGAIVHDAARGRLWVANLKGLPAAREPDPRSGGAGFNSRQYTGSLSLVPVPAADELPALSARVWASFHRGRIARALLPPRPGEPPRPVPERIGEPSVFRHVIYVIKENRTYDQVLGDDPRGDGDPSLCIFGADVTPNQHELVRQFVLLDNTYCCGILSADGHQWSTTAFGTDYLERSFAGWPRSYPDGMGPDEADALAYAPTGFLWDNVLRHGRSLRDYGEFAMPAVRFADPARAGEPDWTACWRAWREGTGEIVFGSEPAIETLRPHLAAGTVGWSMNVPDQFRADFFLAELRRFEAEGGFPALILICLPNDHTSGTEEGAPTPAACVADNDLAFGRIVEAVSKSRFWPETVIFAIEDDPQDGWDHRCGYRTTAYVVSPYTKRGAVVSTFYNTTSILRTIEQILGLPPMNQFDAAAEPMFDCFTAIPDLAPFAAVPNRVALDERNPAPAEVADPLLRRHAELSARLDFDRVDACPEDALNRILWHAVRGSAAPYPEWAVRGPREEEDGDEAR
ncbi:MAG: bifunctional YncE family protein/alkaline phosphatase family protein [Planctomycetota bacterium]